jgi:hypothetical protein
MPVWRRVVNVAGTVVALIAIAYLAGRVIFKILS